MSIRIAVTGVGHWHALQDAAYLIHLPKCEGIALVALQDQDLQRAEYVRSRLDPVLGEPSLFTDYRQMLAECRPDFVIALGRPSVMAEIAHHLLDKGFPFLMEKPMGLNADEVLGIAQKARAVDGFAAVPLFQRYLPFIKRAKEMLLTGQFGPLSHVSLRSIRPGSDRYVKWGSPWMLDPAIAGGGCLRNIGLHALDMFMHILEEDAQVTSARVSSRGHGQRVEDYACVNLQSASGVIGTIEVGNTFPWVGSPNAGADYLASESELLISGRDALLTAAKDGKLRCITAEGQKISTARPTRIPAHAILEDTLERWRAGKPPVTDAWDCWRAMKLVDRAYGLTQQSSR